MRMTTTLGRIEPFDVQSDDWSLYMERLGQFFVANGIMEDARKVAVLLTMMGGKAYGLLHNLLAPVVPSEKYDELVATMKGHLNPKSIVIAERLKFHHRNQREDETVSQYMAELRKLSEHCDFRDYLEEALRDRLVCGLRSKAIQRRLLLENLTLSTAYDLTHGLETASRRARELQASMKDTATIPRDIQQLAPEKPRTEGVSPQSCYRCGKSGHFPEKCFLQATKVQILWEKWSYCQSV